MPHIISMTHAKMMIWKLYAKLVMHAPDTCRVMLGFRIHFPYFSQPNVSKTCSFIHLCIHPSPFWVIGKISQHSPFRCTHIFFFQKLAMISEFFFKEKLEVISFRKHVGFSTRQLFFFFFFLFFIIIICLFLFLVCFFFLFFFLFFFMRYFAT